MATQKRTISKATTKAKPADSRPNAFVRVMATPGAKLANGLVALGLAYVFGSFAIDSGSLMDYAITLLLIVAGVRELVDSLRSWYIHRKEQA